MIKGICYVYEAVKSLTRSREFFEGALGFKLHTNQGSVNGYAIGTHYLVIDEGTQPPPGDRGRGNNVCVEVEDVDAFHSRLKERGIEVSELRDRHWGQRDFYVADPDGYSWCFAQAMRRAPAPK